MQKLRPTVKRNISLFSVEAWADGYGKYFQEMFGEPYPIFFHYDGQKVNFYHPLSEFEKFKKAYTQRLIQDDRLFQKSNADFQARVQELKDLVKNFSLEHIERAYELSGRIMSFYIFVVGDTFVAARPEAWESRHMSEGILYTLDEKVEHATARLLTQGNYDPRLAHVLRTEEIIELMRTGKLSSQAIQPRISGYIYYDQNMITDRSFQAFCRAHDFENPEISNVSAAASEMKGTSAYTGVARGTVRIIHDRQDLAKIQPGDILVSIMTNATFTPVLNKVGAIVTDEGGITCHAAIVARELKKPCIIGTKVATQILKNGDLVEVDADRGIIRKIRA